MRSNSTYNSFPYTITVDTSRDDFAESETAAHPLNSGQPFVSGIETDGDIDVYKIVQEASGPIEIAVGDIPTADPGSEYELIISPSWDGARSFTNDARYVWRSMPRGVYYIHVRSNSTYNSFPYTITVDTSKDN